MRFLKNRTIIVIFGVFLLVIILMVISLYVYPNNAIYRGTPTVTPFTVVNPENSAPILANGHNVDTSILVGNQDFNKYIVLEEEINENGSLVSGKIPYPAMAAPPRTFYYNKSEYYPPFYPEMNDSLKILLGTNEIQDSPEHLNPNLTVNGIYNLPYKLESGPTILGIGGKGSVQLLYNGEHIILKPGDVWTSPVLSIKNETKSGVYNDNNYSFTIQYIGTWQITNKGLFDK